MIRTGKEKGFSLIGLLVACVIVVILMMMALRTYGPTLQAVNSGDNTNALGMNISRMRMSQLHQAEMTYYSIHRSYATWAELVRDGQIPRGYTDRAGAGSPPWVPGHDVEIEVTSSGFTITATPNPQAGMPDDAVILRIDQSGRLEEVRRE